MGQRAILPGFWDAGLAAIGVKLPDSWFCFLKMASPCEYYSTLSQGPLCENNKWTYISEFIGKSIVFIYANP